MLIKNKKPVLIRINILILLIFVLSMIAFKPPIAQTKQGNTLYVNVNGGDDYTSIQEAINAANESDTIYVYSGTYYENIVIDKSLNLLGENIANTIIDGRNNGDVVFLSPKSNYINISKFTIQNSGMNIYDSGINIDSDYNRIVNIIIKNCNCGLSLDFWAHNCIISENVFTNNVKGVSVYSVYPNNNLIYHNNFAENQINAHDNSNSTWFTLGEGNYWDDYNGQDSDGDGIGDTPYDIPGNSTQDKYPLVEPYGTPGFEIIIMFMAISIVIIMIKKKKKR